MKLIIFDIDGTLTDTKSVDDDCFIQAFETTFGIDLQNQKWEEIKNVTDWGITEEIINKHWGRNPTASEYKKMHQTHIQNLKNESIKNKNRFSEIRGASTFFKQLAQKQNIQLGIATGAWEASAVIKLNAIGVNPFIYPFSNSDYHKTREAITLHTIELAKTKYQVDFQDIIYLGDGV